MSRDPRTDPQPGDALRACTGQVVTIRHADADAGIGYTVDDLPATCWASRSDWRLLLRDARVLRTAPPLRPRRSRLPVLLTLALVALAAAALVLSR